MGEFDVDYIKEKVSYDWNKLSFSNLIYLLYYYLIYLHCKKK